jgi:glycosyltransferase involved in cell wall biosynthesis
MRIGIVLDEPPQLGGGFQQSLSSILSLSSLRTHECVVFTNRAENLTILRAHGLPCAPHNFNRYRRQLARAILSTPLMRRVFRHLPRVIRNCLEPFEALLDRYNIDLVVCFFLSWVPNHVYRHPFITTVYDLCHRDRPEFPEVSERYEFESRERYLRDNLPRALAVVVSSSSLGDKLARYYGVDQARIVVLPFLPGAHVRERAPESRIAAVKQKYQLADKYIFYPAQFWPHKNHIYILEALQALKETAGITLPAVFSGTDFGNEAFARKAAEELGLKGSVHFLGFIDSTDMQALYSGASALVMPTYFGPTNLPPLEAFATQCPVIYSDLPEFRQDLGNAALYCDLRDPGSLARQLYTILTEPSVVSDLKQAGSARVASTSSELYAQTFQALLDDLAYIRRRWK